MPNYRGHLLGGAATFGLLFYLGQKTGFIEAKNFAKISTWLLACLLGSLFPDIDITSKGQRLLYASLLIIIPGIILSQEWFLFLPVTLIAIFPLLVRHRGITHRVPFILAAPFVVSAIIAYYNQSAGKLVIGCYPFFVLGALSHLLLDRLQTKLFR